jgi:hypothetical protein
VNTEINSGGRGLPRWEWIVGPLATVALVSCSRLGHRLPMEVQDIAFLVVVGTPIFLIAKSWDEYQKMRRDGKVSRWRIWISLCGCVALLLALVFPFIAFYFGLILRLDWRLFISLCLASSLVSLLAGIFGARPVRFPLIFGSLIMSGLVLIIPVGVL